MFFPVKTLSIEEKMVNCCLEFIPRGFNSDAKRYDILKEVEKMLSKFKEIIYEEIPKRLLPVWSI